MANAPGTPDLGDREGFVLWIEREARDARGALRGVLERTDTSERVAFESGESLLAILRGATSKASEDKETTR